jgi:hypothetical protein
MNVLYCPSTRCEDVLEACYWPAAAGLFDPSVEDRATIPTMRMKEGAAESPDRLDVHFGSMA